jgi:hypothetical protein
MTRLDELPPDQRAALALLLGQRKSYAELATTLRIPERAVHDRAHAALAMLAPQLARGLDTEQREQVGDFLLGQQQGVSERLATRTLLGQSQAARAWAGELATTLAPLSAQPLPQIPAADAATAERDGAAQPAHGPAPTQPARGQAPSAVPRPPQPPSTATGTGSPSPPGDRSAPALPSSRVGGAIVLALIVAGIVVAVLLLTKGSSSHNQAAGSSARRTTSTTVTGPHIDQRFTLSSPSGGRAVGAVALLSEGGKRAFYIAAEHLPQTQGRPFHYDIWLRNAAKGNSLALSEAPQVGSSGQLAGGAFLPANAAEYNEMLLTHETSRRPAQPGPVLLSGRYHLSS